MTECPIMSHIELSIRVMRLSIQINIYTLKPPLLCLKYSCILIVHNHVET